MPKILSEGDFRGEVLYLEIDLIQLFDKLAYPAFNMRETSP